MEVADKFNSSGDAVPKAFAKVFSAANKYDGVMNDNNAKARLADKAFPLMTADRLNQRDPDGEVTSWFRRIAKMLRYPQCTNTPTNA